MKTTVEIPDRLYRQIKARAALRAPASKAFFLDALREKLAHEVKGKSRASGWRAAFGKGDSEAVADVQRVIDEEFSKIDTEGWD